MLLCGAGLEPVGNTAGNPARFIVETFSAGHGDLTVTVLNPRGIQEPASSFSGVMMRFLCTSKLSAQSLCETSDTLWRIDATVLYSVILEISICCNIQFTGFILLVTLLSTRCGITYPALGASLCVNNLTWVVIPN